MTGTPWLRDLEARASELRHKIINLQRKPYEPTEYEWNCLLGDATSLWRQLQAHRQAAGLPAPPLVRLVPGQIPEPSTRTVEGSEGAFDA